MLKRHPMVLNCIWVIVLLALPLPLVVVLDVGLAPTAASQLLPIDAGIVAYVWWLAAVALATRPRWLDRLVGLPKMYLVHSLLGVGALALAFVHRHLLMSMGRWIRLTGDIAWYLAIFGVIYAFVFLSGVLVDRFAVVARVKRWLEHVCKHQVSIWLHRLNLVAILLVWLHVNLIGRISIHFGFMTLFDLYTVAALGCYCWAKWGAPAGYLRGKVVENKPLSAQAQRIVVEFDTDGAGKVDGTGTIGTTGRTSDAGDTDEVDMIGAPSATAEIRGISDTDITDMVGTIDGAVDASMESDKAGSNSGIDSRHNAGNDIGSSYPAGSYYFFTFPDISGESHPFSVSSAPSHEVDDMQGDMQTGAQAVFGGRGEFRMALTVRKLGDYTKKLASLRIGSEVRGEGPFGQFNAAVERCVDEGTPVVFIGMGTGIAPLFSLAREYAGWLPIHVFWTVSNQSEAYFDREFQALAGSGRIQYDMQVGRLKAGQVPHVFSADELNRARFFIVGPAQGVIGVERMLRREGVGRGRLVDERLTM